MSLKYLAHLHQTRPPSDLTASLPITHIPTPPHNELPIDLLHPPSILRTNRSPRTLKALLQVPPRDDGLLVLARLVVGDTIHLRVATCRAWTLLSCMTLLLCFPPCELHRRDLGGDLGALCCYRSCGLWSTVRPIGFTATKRKYVKS